MRLISIPANPVPEDAATAMLQTPDGVLLRYARWAPPPGRKGTVCIFQGRTEFIEKYFEVVRDLRARGFAVATFDWRGQGLSQRPLYDRYKGHVESFAEYETDLETFMREIVLPDCPPPLFALAHSMGATILVQAAAKGHRWFDRMVLTTPMIRLARRRMLGLAPGVARIMRIAGMGTRYVPAGEIEWWEKNNDPIDRFEKFLLDQKVANKEKLEEITAGVMREIDEDCEWAESSPMPEPEGAAYGVFDNSNVPPALRPKVLES